MDSKLRELERKANTGDYEAAHQLQRLRVRAGVREIGNRPAKWRKHWEKFSLPEEQDAEVWCYYAPGYARYAYVTGPIPKYSKDIEPSQESKRWKWEAGVMVCMYPDGTDRIKGYATSFEGAKRIVEVVCQETGTCMPKKEKK